MTEINKVSRLNEAFDVLKRSGIVGTQKDLASKMGMQRSTVNAALNGTGDNPTDSFLRKFARAFDFNPIYLITGEGELKTGKNSYTIHMRDNSGNVSNGGVGDNLNVHGRNSDEHDELIKLRSERSNLITILETIDDPNSALAVISGILGAKVKFKG